MAKWSIPAFNANRIKPVDIIVRIAPVGIAQLGLFQTNLKPQIRVK